MTDWGSHGSGDDSERLTPFVMWGAGVESIKYNFEELITLKQVDIAPLMSYLIGVPIPINSIVKKRLILFMSHYCSNSLNILKSFLKGKIPLNILSVSDKEKCLAFKMNAMQILEQLKVVYFNI